MTTTPPARRVLSHQEVADLFLASTRSITRWARDGRIPSFITAGGQRRFYADEIEPLAAEMTTSRKTEAV